MWNYSQALSYFSVEQDKATYPKFGLQRRVAHKKDVVGVLARAFEETDAIHVLEFVMPKMDAPQGMVSFVDFSWVVRVGGWELTADMVSCISLPHVCRSKRQQRPPTRTSTTATREIIHPWLLLPLHIRIVGDVTSTGYTSRLYHPSRACVRRPLVTFHHGVHLPTSFTSGGGRSHFICMISPFGGIIFRDRR